MHHQPPAAEDESWVMSSCQKQTRPTQHQPTSSPCCTTSSVVLLALLAAPLVVVDKVCHWPLPAAAANYVPVSSQLFTSLQEFISFQELSESVLVVFIIVSSFIVAWFAYNQAAAPWLQTHLLHLASSITTTPSFVSAPPNTNMLALCALLCSPMPQAEYRNTPCWIERLWSSAYYITNIFGEGSYLFIPPTLRDLVLLLPHILYY